MMNKNRRTLILGILATATLVWSAIVHFDVPAREMAWLFIYSALGVLAIALVAAISVAGFMVFRFLLRSATGGNGRDGDGD